MKARSIAIKTIFPIILACLDFLATEKAARAIVTADDPNNHLLSPNDFTGVVSFQVFGEHRCTGSLLDGGAHILTAAHCITNASTLLNANLDDMRVAFSLPEGQFYRNLSDAVIFPEWNDDGSITGFIQGGDLAILRLAELAPQQAEQYKIYRNTDEVGQIAQVVGYGSYGTGSTGAIFGTQGQKKIVGENKFEALIDDFNDVLPITNIASPGSQLIADFDNGLAENDSLGFILGISDLGLGRQEVSIANGDSGAPWFIQGKIAGVVSYGAGYPFIPSPSDIDTSLNSSFGELSSNTRVSSYAGFIDNVIAESTSQPVSEPSSLLGLLALGTLGVSSLLKLKKTM